MRARLGSRKEPESQGSVDPQAEERRTWPGPESCPHWPVPSPSGCSQSCSPLPPVQTHTVTRSCTRHGLGQGGGDGSLKAEREQCQMGGEKDSQPEGRSGEGNPARCSSQGPPQGDPSRMERWVGWFLSKDAPNGGGDDDAQNHTANDDHDLLLQGHKRQASEEQRGYSEGETGLRVQARAE